MCCGSGFNRCCNTSLRMRKNKEKTMQIIIVEDEENIRKELKQLLQNAMYEVTTIESFSDVAGQITRMEPMPDLVLLDLNLPEESGIRYKRLYCHPHC